MKANVWEPEDFAEDTVATFQIYMPLTMIVFCSWVTFFLIKTEKGGEVPARTALGANAILSIVNVGFGGKSRNGSTDLLKERVNEKIRLLILSPQK